MIAQTLIATVIGIAALTGTATPTPAPDAAPDTVTVFSENVSNQVTAEPQPTSERLATLHEGDVLQLLDPTPVDGTWGTMWHVLLDDGRTGYLPTKVAIVSPTVTLDDLTQPSMIVDPAAGTTWLGELAAGSSTAFLYPTTMSARVGAPALGETFNCAPPVSGSAGVLGEVAFQPCEVNGTLAYIRAEHVAPTVDLTDVDFSGSVTTVSPVPVYENPAAGADTIPLATLAAGVEAETGAPVGGFTPIRVGDDEGWAPTKVLMNIESWTDKLKDKATEVWGETKEIVSDGKDKVEEKLTEVEAPAAVIAVRDIPALILSAVLALLTLAMAWLRKVSIFKLGHSVRRALNLAAVIPLTILATVAPIASYGFLLWIVLGIAGAVGIGVFTGFRPDLSRFATAIRERKTQIIVGASVVVGALTGALVTGFSGWLAPVVTGALALTAALGYLLSTPDEKTPEGETTPIDETVETAPEGVSDGEV